MGEDGFSYSRNGHFTLSENGKMVNSSGKALMGHGGPITIDVLAERVVVDKDGRVYEDETLIDQIKLVKTDTPHLERTGKGVRPHLLKEEETLSPEVKVMQGYLEMSNVNPIGEMTRLIQQHKGFEVGYQMLRLQDEVLRKIVNEMAMIRS
jgi:flagellar basal body rod protein FlgG